MGKLLLAAVSVGVAGVIALVHYQQIRDRREMHKGVTRDIERQEAKRRTKDGGVINGSNTGTSTGSGIR